MVGNYLQCVVRWKLNVAFEIDDAAFVYIITKLDFAK